MQFKVILKEFIFYCVLLIFIVLIKKVIAVTNTFQKILDESGRKPKYG